MLVGCAFIAGGISGYWLTPLMNLWERILIVIIGIMIVVPEMASTLTGISVGILLTLWYMMKGNNDSRTII